MILRKVTLSNWRALEKFEMELDLGLNVLQGRNEAGKSSVVEAIDWALYRDLSGSRIPTAEIRSIVPAGDPTARPSVEVDLEFPDCRVTLLKILAEDSVKRECHLTLRRDGHADEHFDRTDAQRRLRALISADGLGEEKGGAAGGGLMVSHQGESADFLSDGTAAIRSTLGIGSDGQLALTARLERARAALETLRRREILQELEISAIEVARAGTDAARARDELKEARFQLEHFQQISASIEELRDRLEDLGGRLQEVGPRQMEAKAQMESLSSTLLAQNEADKIVLNIQGREQIAKAALDQAQSRSDEIARLRLLQAETRRELEGSEGAVEQAQGALESARQLCDAAHEEQERAVREAETSRHLADAWRHYEAVFIARSALNDEKKALEGLQGLGAVLLEAQKNRDALSKVPTLQEIQSWKTSFEALTRLKSEAANGVQVELTLAQDLNVQWTPDGGRTESSPLQAGEERHLGAITEGRLILGALGELRIRTGARGVEELKAEVKAAEASIGKDLQPWNISLADLPAAFADIESQRLIFDAAESAWKEAAENLRREEIRFGSLAQAQSRVSERELEFQSARKSCEAFEGVIELGGKGRREVRAALEAAEAEAKESSARANRLRNDAAKASQTLRQAETEWHRVKARPDALREALSNREQDIARLENDGLDEAARAVTLMECHQNLARVRFEREEAEQARRSMGDGVSQWKLSEARRVAEELSQQRESLEMEKTACERDLFHACGQDAGAEIERLTYKVEDLEMRASRHEARLRGVLLLDAILQAERARLSRDLAGPLNEKLGPWLTQLRGKETSLAFDSSGSRIENILSRNGESTISLPFAEHSEGLKEQVAFALRLLLASRVASHLPSKRLPLVLDDPFTQSDASRTGGLGSVLKEAERNLQILFVTCHGAPHVDGLVVNTIRLGPWEDVGATDEMVKRSKKSPKEVVLKVRSKEQSLALF